MPSRRDLQRLLREQFGHDAFRPGQERIIRMLLESRDVLAVLPTGAGKSLVFQLTAQLLPGLTVVVSPLIALMKDQAESVEQSGLAAGVINSTRTASEREADLTAAERGELKLLYVTPERFQNGEFTERLRAIGVSLLAVDEAHCVSEWGHDFRPSYLRLKQAAEQLDRPILLALTATASPWIRRDVAERLGMRDPVVVVYGLDRPNLFVEVRGVQSEAEDARVLRELLHAEAEEYPADLSSRLGKAMQGSGIIYCLTTAAAEETAGWLREWGIPADFYHGQRSAAERERAQEAFMAGEIRVIAATSAFGLGIDKPDVRFVIHRDVPASVDEYYQEAGRAGRDGALARCTLIYRAADLGRASFLAAGSTVSANDLSAIRELLRAAPERSLADLTEQAPAGEARVRRALELLVQHGLVELEGELVRLLVPDFDPERISLEAEESRKAYERSRVQMMRGYAELWDCRRRYLLNYFGEEAERERCEHCDNDTRTDRQNPTEPERAPAAFAVGATVRHSAWGEGTVMACQHETVTVSFSGEEKTLAIDVALENGLLEVLSIPDHPSEPEPAEGAFQVGDTVEHAEYGAGEVHRVTPEAVVVLFEKAGYHTLDRERVEGEGLLEPSSPEPTRG
jgi:ATP-dependent DNA helicase RecQ